MLRLIVFTGIFLQAFLCAVQAAQMTVRFYEQAEVSGATVTLGEIAQIDAKSDIDVSYLRNLRVSRAPQAGEESRLDSQRLAGYLQRIESRLQDAQWQGAERIQVRRPGQRLSGQQQVAWVEDYIHKHKSPLVEQMRFMPSRTPRPVVVPKGTLHYEIMPGDSQLLQARSFTALVRVDGRLQANITIRGELQAMAPVAVAANNLERGQLLTRQDVQLKKRDISELRHPVLDPAKVAGKELKRSLDRGEVIPGNRLEQPALVERGDGVTVLVQTGGLRLSAAGEARQDGKKGEVIRVRNSNSGEMLRCRVVAKGKVEVEL